MAVARDQYLDIIIQTISPILDRLRSVQFGPKLHTKLLNLYPKLNAAYQNINFLSKRNIPNNTVCI